MTATLVDYMTRHVHTIAAESTVDEARVIMLQHSLRHLPVLDGAIVVGVWSERDVAFAERAGAGNKRLDELLPDNVYAIDSRTSLSEVAAVMADRTLGSAVVLERGSLAGIFTTVDACRALSDVVTILDRERSR